MSLHLGALSPLAEHSASPVPLTERGPLSDTIGRALHRSKRTRGARLKFENRSTGLRPPIPLIICFTAHDYSTVTSYPEGNFGVNQLLGGSMSLSPLYPNQTSDLHVNIAADLHQGFPRLHPIQA